MPHGGFTLVELLVVIAIGIILTGLGMGIGSRLIANARAIQCMGNLKALTVALQGYVNDHNQKFPTMAVSRETVDEEVDVLDTVLLPYLDREDVVACPADKKLAKKSGTSYYWNSTLNGQFSSDLNMFKLIERPSGIPVFSDKEGWHKYSAERVNVIYADGGTGRGIKFEIR